MKEPRFRAKNAIRHSNSEEKCFKKGGGSVCKVPLANIQPSIGFVTSRNYGQVPKTFYSELSFGMKI